MSGERFIEFSNQQARRRRRKFHGRSLWRFFIFLSFYS
jgi:hypothetical protein